MSLVSDPARTPRGTYLARSSNRKLRGLVTVANRTYYIRTQRMPQPSHELQGRRNRTTNRPITSTRFTAAGFGRSNQLSYPRKLDKSSPRTQTLRLPDRFCRYTQGHHRRLRIARSRTTGFVGITESGLQAQTGKRSNPSTLDVQFLAQVSVESGSPTLHRDLWIHLESENLSVSRFLFAITIAVVPSIRKSFIATRAAVEAIHIQVVDGICNLPYESHKPSIQEDSITSPGGSRR